MTIGVEFDGPTSSLEGDLADEERNGSLEKDFNPGTKNSSLAESKAVNV